jgi:processing peptidase subunit beta
MGARFEKTAGREVSHMSVTCFKNDTGKVVDLLGDALCNASLDAAEFELCKEDLADEHTMNTQEYKNTTMENSHYNSYRDHQMGQPIKGDADNTSSLTVDDLQTYRASNYFGDNMVVVGTGNINHDEFVQ